jgi:DNA primase
MLREADRGVDLLAEISNIAEEIKDRADIVDHIGRVVKLRKRGALWEGLCPFHGEKTPSFKVYEDSRHFHCFGCGASGDVINFYMKYYNLDFMETAMRLAEELNIDWRPGGKYESEAKKDDYYNINREAAVFYHEALRVPGNPAFEYLSGRGLSSDTMRAFGLGYADRSRDGLCRHLIDKGLSLEKAAEMTLIFADGGDFRDRYFGRVMFPIMNVRGKVVGFSSRTLDPDEKARKYVNSSESKIFKKKEHLYALGSTKDFISSSGRTAILVEGQMDVISVWQHGVKNVAGTGGTSLTAEQARLLKRYADKIILAFDMDGAGREAALRGGEVLRAAGLDVRVMSYGGKDPDEFIRAKGREAFLAQAEAASPFLEYKLTQIMSGFDLGHKDGAVMFLKEASMVLSLMSPVERDYYVKWLESMTGISASAIEEETALARPKGMATVDAPKSAEHSSLSSSVSRSAPFAEAARMELQRHILRLLLHEPAFLADLRGREKIFVNPQLARIFAAAEDMAENSPDEYGPDAVMSSLAPEDADVLKRVMSTVFIESNPRRQLENCLAKADEDELCEKKMQVERALARMLDGADSADGADGADGSDGPDSAEDEHSEDIKQLSQQLSEINNELLKVKERAWAK